jgi:hypothetical protein
MLTCALYFVPLCGSKQSSESYYRYQLGDVTIGRPIKLKQLRPSLLEAKHMSVRPTATVFARARAGVFVALLVAFCCLTANAQSGRRQVKPPPSAPVPTPTPEPTPKPSPKRDENEVNFLVAAGDRGSFRYAPFTFSDAARDGCATRLREKTALAVDVSPRELTRNDAIKKAKAGKTTYVVLVTLIEDTMSANSSGDIELEIDYVVFAPETAKVVASGRTYEASVRKGPVSVGRRGSTLPTYREASVRRAGEDAGERIAKSLHLSDPPPKKSTD